MKFLCLSPNRMDKDKLIKDMPQNMCSPTGGIKRSKGSYKSWKC